MNKLTLFLNALKPSSLKSNLEPVFLIGSLFSLSLSIAVCLILFHILFTFNTGLIAAMRGVLPQIIVYEGPHLNPDFMEPVKAQKIYQSVARISEKASVVEEIFIRDLDFLFSSGPINNDSTIQDESLENSEQIQGGHDTTQNDFESPVNNIILLRSDFKMVSKDHLKNSLMKDLLPGNILEQLVDNDNVIAVSEDLLRSIKNSGITSNCGKKIILLQGEPEENQDESGNAQIMTRDVEIIHVFGMVEGGFSRLAIGNRDLLEFVKPGTQQPNMIGIYGLGRLSLQRFKNKLLNLLNSASDGTDLNSEVDVTNKTQHVKTWTDTMPYKIQRFVKYTEWSAITVWGLTSIPVIILIITIFGFYIQKKNLYINLMRIFGLQAKYLRRMIFVTGLLTGMVCCIAGFIFYFLAIHYLSEYISAALYGAVSLDFSSRSFFSLFNILNIAVLSFLCGLISLIPAGRVYNQSPADLLIK